MYSRWLPATSTLSRPLATALVDPHPALGTGAPGLAGAIVPGISAPGAAGPPFAPPDGCIRPTVMGGPSLESLDIGAVPPLGSAWSAVGAGAAIIVGVAAGVA
jgi:hypothetical protein